MVRRDANSQVWQRTTYERGADGKVVAHTHKYTELGGGLNYKDARGNWQPSQEIIESDAHGAIARQGPYQVLFAHNLNSEGAIDLQTPDGKRLRSNILGLGYVDETTGKVVLIGKVQNSQGELISDNQVLYPNAFAGVKADVRYTYKKGSFEQDVILRQQPPTPESFGLNSATTEIEVMTEFINPPAGKITGSEINQDISWGTMSLGQGKAFALNSLQDSPVLVHRQYMTVEGRKVLLEKVPVSRMEPALRSLPSYAGIRLPSPQSATLAAVLPQTPSASGDSGSMELASAAPSDQGYVLDYVEIDGGSLTNFTFQGNTTYFVNGWITLYGTTTIEGGTVVKFAWGEALYSDLRSSSINCKTGPYHVAIFTSMNDDSVGETISGSSGSPSYEDGSEGLFLFYGSAELHDLRFSYGDIGIANTASIDLWNCQFVDLQTAIEGKNVGLHNVLISVPEIGTDYGTINLSSSGSLDAENATIDGPGAGGFLSLGSASTVALTNCLITHDSLLATGSASPTVLSTNKTFFPSSSPYQSFFANYYLANSSSYRGAGTTNINPILLAELRNKTTRPPKDLSSYRTVRTNLTLSPLVPRDTNATPDVGYHYDPLDYSVWTTIVTSNTLTIQPGTALGMDIYDSFAGTVLETTNSGKIICQGTATQPIAFVTRSMVDEQVYEWPGGTLVNANCNFGFTKFFTAQDDDPLQIYATNILQNCELYGGDYLYLVSPQIFNSLFDDVSNVVWFPSINNSVMRNNTFVNCESVTLASSPGTVVASANLFDTTGTFNSTGAGHLTGGDNAFYNCSDGLSLSTDTTYSGEPGYQDGPLGNYYLPPGSPLIDAGDTTAAVVGLNSFTTQTNQTPDTGTVDIGYHYPTSVTTPAGSSLGTDFWLMYCDTYDEDDTFPVMSLLVTSPQGASGTVTANTNGPMLTMSGFTNFLDPGMYAQMTGTYVWTNLSPTVLTAFESAAGYNPGNVYLKEATNFIYLNPTTSPPVWWWGYYDGSSAQLNIFQGQGLGLDGALWRIQSGFTTWPTSSCPGSAVSLPFTVAAGGSTNLILPPETMFQPYDEVANGGVHVTANAPVAVYGSYYSPNDSAAVAVYPTPLLGTNYCLMARASSLEGANIPDASQFAIVATVTNTTVWILPSMTANLAGSLWANPITLQPGQVYQINSQDFDESDLINGDFSIEDDFTNDVTGTLVSSDKPIGVFAGANIAFVPDFNTVAGNPLVQEQFPVNDWGTNIIAMSFAGRTNGDTFRILAAYSNTTVTVTGTVVTVTGFSDGITFGWSVITNNVTVTNFLDAGDFFDVIVEGPVFIQANNPIQVAQFSNGENSDLAIYGDPAEILLPPTSHYLTTNVVVSLPDDGVTGKFVENFLNLLVPQSATNSTLLDGSIVAVTNYVAIGTSGYYGAQLTLTNAGTHIVTSSQAVGVEVYGFGGTPVDGPLAGGFDAYSYLGGWVP